MSSRVLSRILPVADGDTSISVFESLRRDQGRYIDLEAQRQPATAEPFHDEDEPPDAFLYEAQNEQDPLESATLSPETPAADRWLGKGNTRRSDEDEDVPESLLLETRGKSAPKISGPQRSASNVKARREQQWQIAQQHQGLHDIQVLSGRGNGPSRPQTGVNAGAAVTRPDPKANAMWEYTNASNLDAFLLEVYDYYVAHGVWSILLRNALSLLTEIFVVSFAMFLTTCIDYKLVPGSNKISQVLVPKCMSKAVWWKNVALFFLIIWWCWKLGTYIGDIRRLFRLQNFFHHVLEINDQDIQTVAWPQVVDGLVKLQNANIATAKPGPSVRNYTKYTKPQQRMDAEAIANRLMRQDNYYVALYNKDILDFTLPLPFVGTRQFYSKSLEWCIDFCLTNFIFDEQGSIRPFCLDVRNRRALVQALQNRLRLAALTSIVVAPINIVRFCIIFFFRYYTEFTRNPSKASARAFTPHAEWKIRQFNELDHLFQRRLRQAMPFANDYLKQFPKDKTDQLCRFVAFVSGAIAAVLTLATLFDPELFLGFEITPGRTAVFWLTIMVGIFGVAHGMLPEETEIHDPVRYLNDVLIFTGYKPKHWKGRLHSSEVRAEFSTMYQMKIVIFVEELLSLVVAPWILLRNAGTRCERVIDFFREHTVHVDGIGNQCNFAVFGFKKDPNAEDPSAVLQENDGLRDEYYGLKDDKMMASVQNFAQYYSHYSHVNRRQGSRRAQGWQPPPAWPPLLSPPIAEEGQIMKSGIDNKALGVKGLSMLDARQASRTRSPRHVPRNPREARLQAARSDATASKLAVTPLATLGDEAGSRIMTDEELDALHAGSEAEVDDDGDKVDNPGVLGLLYQFSKAQTEGKGTGVGI
ncbi:hypothetical protein Tdes44962_MAKER02807 [Teratosphaeria destructans]|uniref:Autophagy-related protein 9 n=1 Tax=Teratosphaeria destructans TaxID=418781 RepID=A0A9W7SS12_9PEZI|nr:hypothetical protein Tdes44962_MAKER02807 [Teratosphaeria destructans]